MALKRLDQFNFHHILAETDGISLVLFTAAGCGACRQLRHVIDRYPQEFVLLNLFEVDAGHEMALTHEFEVFHLPSLFLFKDGHFHAQIQAEPLPQALIAAIEAALSRPAQEAP